MLADEAYERFKKYSFHNALNIGSRTEHPLGNCTTIDLNPPADIVGDYMDHRFSVDAIWCSHVLEHQMNPGMFVAKMVSELSEGGVLAVTVPPLKHFIVSGHVTLWNEGLLLYHLVLAGLDCSNARVGRYGYNISVIVEKRSATLPKFSGQDYLDKVSHLFPVPVTHGFDGRIGNVKW